MSAVVVLLFTDLVGSTSLIDSLGDDAAEAVRRTHFQLLRDAVAGRGGHEVKNLGDGLMVVFPGAVDAVSCAVEMQQAIGRHNDVTGDHRLEVRVGLHVGDPIQDEGDYFGAPVATAKRICDAAEGGQILVSGLVRDLVGARGGFEFTDLGELSLKGLSDPVPAFDVRWAPEASSDRLPPALSTAEGLPYVGRKDESARLRRVWDGAAVGSVAVAFVAGEPGIGKTRLASELARQVDALGGQVIAGRCDEDPLRPYQPFVEALSGLIAVHGAMTVRGWVGDDSPLAQLGAELRDAFSGSPPDAGADRERLFDDVVKVLAGATNERPLLLVLDDLHWADRPTLLLLRHIVRTTRLGRCVVLGTYRDTELRRTHPLSELLADLRREHTAERVRLVGLTTDETVALIRGAAGHDLDDRGRAFVDALQEQTEGNPFFIGEVWRHLTESGRITEKDGRWGSEARSLEELGIPEGVREVLGRRLSRLSDSANEILTLAAVLGRQFAVSHVVEMAAGDSRAVIGAIEEALAAGLVNELASQDEPACAFSHALVRQTIYEELSLPRRQQLHLAAADALDGRAPVAAVALHLRQAGAAANPQRTIDCSVRAGEAALAAFAYEDAAGHWESALEVMARHESEGRGRLLERLSGLMFQTGLDPAKGVSLLEEALSLYESQGDRYRAARVHSRLGTHLSTVGAAPILDLDAAMHHLKAAAAVISEGPESAALAYVLIGIANVHMRWLELAAAGDAAERALGIARRMDDPALLVSALLLRSWNLFDSGHFAEGETMIEEAYDRADRLDHGGLAFLSAWNRTNQAMMLHDFEAATTWAARELDLPRLTGSPGARRLLLSNWASAEHQLRGEAAALTRWQAEGLTEEGLRQHWWAGREEEWEANQASVEQEVARARGLGDRWGLGFGSSRVLTNYWLRMSERIREDATEIIESAYPRGAVVFEMDARCWRVIGGEVAPDIAEADLRRCRELLGSGEDWRGLVGLHALAEGVAASRSGKDGASRFQAALDAYERYRNPRLASEAFRLWGLDLVARGESAAALDKFDRGLDVLRRANQSKRLQRRLEEDRARVSAG